MTYKFSAFATAK